MTMSSSKKKCVADSMATKKKMMMEPTFVWGIIASFLVTAIYVDAYFSVPTAYYSLIILSYLPVVLVVNPSIVALMLRLRSARGIKHYVYGTLSFVVPFSILGFFYLYLMALAVMSAIAGA